MKFSTTLKTDQTSRKSWTLLDDLVYGDVIVPKGFETNFASFSALHNVFLFPLYALVSGYGNYAATVHDYLYTQAELTRKECDVILYEALRAEGVAKWRAWIFYVGVRLGGKSHYGVK